MPDPAECAQGLTLDDGVLTIATGDPAYPPYVVDDDPTSGEGFESAVAYAVAEQMGFDHDHVAWVRTTFDEAIQPGPKNFDFNLQQFSITPERSRGRDVQPAVLHHHPGASSATPTRPAPPPRRSPTSRP